MIIKSTLDPYRCRNQDIYEQRINIKEKHLFMFEAKSAMGQE